MQKRNSGAHKMKGELLSVFSPSHFMSVCTKTPPPPPWTLMLSPSSWRRQLSSCTHTHTHTPNLKTHSSVELFGLGERVRAACELVNHAPAPSTDIKMYNIRPAEREGGAFSALRNSLFFSFFCGCLSPVDFIYRFYELCVKVWAPYFLTLVPVLLTSLHFCPHG